MPEYCNTTWYPDTSACIVSLDMLWYRDKSKHKSTQLYTKQQLTHIMSTKLRVSQEDLFGNSTPDLLDELCRDKHALKNSGLFGLGQKGTNPAIGLNVYISPKTTGNNPAFGVETTWVNL